MNRVGRRREAIALEHHATRRVYRLDGGFSTDSTTRRRVEVAFEASMIHVDAGAEQHRNHVCTVGLSPPTVGCSGENAFAQQKACRKLDIVPGCAHRDRYGLVADANLERLLDRYKILNGF